MKIFIRDLSTITVKVKDANEKRVRFSVTYAEDTGEPVSTERGWTIDAVRKVRPPSSRTAYGRYQSYIEPSEELLVRLQNALNKMSFVIENLGPVVEEIASNGELRSTEEAEA